MVEDVKPEENVDPEKRSALPAKEEERYFRKCLIATWYLKTKLFAWK